MVPPIESIILFLVCHPGTELEDYFPAAYCVYCSKGIISI